MSLFLAAIIALFAVRILPGSAFVLVPLRIPSSPLSMASEVRGPEYGTIEKARKVLDRVVKTVQYTSEKPVRVKYAATMATRFGFFLGQGVGINLLGIDKNAKEKQNSIEPAAIIGALTDAILAESDVRRHVDTYMIRGCICVLMCVLLCSMYHSST